MGAWIETEKRMALAEVSSVAPYMGAWIETNKILAWNPFNKSLPIWERGLKQLTVQQFAR